MKNSNKPQNPQNLQSLQNNELFKDLPTKEAESISGGNFYYAIATNCTCGGWYFNTAAQTDWW